MAYPANYIPEVWSRKTQKIFDKSTVMGKIVNRDYEGEIKNAGDTVYIRSFGDITIKNYTREQTLDFETLTDPSTTMSIDTQKYFAFRVDDLDKAQSDISIYEGYAKRAAMAIRNVVDQAMHAEYANVDSGNVLGSSGAPITITKDNVYFYVTELGRLMDDSNAPADGRHLVVDPTRKAVMLNSPEFLRATALGDKTVQNGAIGEIGGFQVHVSTNLNSSSGNRPILALTRDLITFAMQVSKTEFVRPTNQFVDVYKGLYLFGSHVCTNSDITMASAPDAQGAVLWASGT